MTHEISPYYSPSSALTLSRLAKRQAASIKRQALNRVERIHATLSVAKAAQNAVMQLSAHEGWVISVVPLAENRVRAIGDIAAMAMANIVAETLY